MCPLIHFVPSFGVAFGNLSPFGRLWLITPDSGLRSRLSFLIKINLAMPDFFDNTTALKASLSHSAITVMGLVILPCLSQAQASWNCDRDRSARSRVSRVRIQSSNTGMRKGILNYDRQFSVVDTGDTSFELPGTGSNPRSICGSVNNQSNIYAPPRVGVNDTYNQF